MGISDLGHIAALITSLGSLIGVIAVAVKNRRDSKRTVRRDELEALREIIDELIEENARLRGEVQELRYENEVLRERMRSLEAENIHLRAMIADLKQENQELKERMKGADGRADR